MNEDLSILAVAGSMLGTYALLLFFSKRFRDDHAKVLRMEKYTIQLLIEHPWATFALILSLILPVYLLDLPL